MRSCCTSSCWLLVMSELAVAWLPAYWHSTPGWSQARAMSASPQRRLSLWWSLNTTSTVCEWSGTTIIHTHTNLNCRDTKWLNPSFQSFGANHLGLCWGPESCTTSLRPARTGVERSVKLSACTWWGPADCHHMERLVSWCRWEWWLVTSLTTPRSKTTLSVSMICIK